MNNEKNSYIIVLKYGVGIITFNDNIDMHQYTMNNLYECQKNEENNNYIVHILFSYHFIFKGLDYLLTESKIPILIMKDELMRCDKEKGVSNNKGYTWLILFDGTNTKSFNVLEYFWPLIDRQKDFIYVLTLVNNFFYSDQIKDKFIKKMDQYNLRENINYYYYFDCVPGQSTKI